MAGKDANLSEEASWFAWRNLIIGRSGREACSVYRLGGAPARTEDANRRALGSLDLQQLSELLGADFAVLRVTRPWSVTEYAMGFEAVADVRHTSRQMLRRYVEAQSAALDALQAHSVDFLLSVRLPTAAPASGEPVVLRALAELEERMLRRLQGWVRASRLDCEEIGRVVLRAYQRGLSTNSGFGDCALSQKLWAFDRIPAVKIDPPGGLTAPPRLNGQSIRIDSKLGVSHQAFLRAENFPASGRAHGFGLDRVFAGLEVVDFPVDVLIRVRRLEPRPGRPTFGAMLSLAVGAPSASALERRVVRLRRALRGVRLRRSSAEQLRLFSGHLPRVADGPVAASALTVPAEPFSTAAPTVGSSAGPYLGHTLSGTPRPVLFHPFEGHQRRGSTATLLSGAAGSGKTLTMELIMYQAFVAGAAVIDVDLCGDHALERLPDLAPEATVLELSAASRFRGLLDPLRIGPARYRQRLACEFLTGLLQGQPSPVLRAQIAEAVSAVIAKGAGSCGEVLVEMRRGSQDAQRTADLLEAAASSGIAALGFADRNCTLDPERQRVTVLRLRAVEIRYAPKRSWTARLDRLILRLLAVYAAQLAKSHEERRCVVGIDDASELLLDNSGKALVDWIASVGQAGSFATLISARLLEDPSWAQERFGAALCFRAQDDCQAKSVERLLEGSAGADGLASRLLNAGPGECVIRDRAGRAAPVQVEFVDDRLLQALDTTPIVP
jgi:hypothetical protein